jgi:hypothetical protein
MSRKVGVMNSSTLSVEELVHVSSLIFTGVVVERGTSTVPAVQPNVNLVVVRLERALRVDPVLGDLYGKMITVAAIVPETLSPGRKAVFFTNSWIHGRGIAVREVGHVDISEEEVVAAAVAQLPQIHLSERLQNAKLVVNAEVMRISPVERKSFERNAALWAAAELKVDKVLKGKPSDSTMVYFPTSDHPLWARAPHFKERQRGIFILHTPSRDATPSEESLQTGSLVALDHADFQSESKLADVKKLLATLKQKEGVQ